jgi:pyruvate formate lyase activating enzyme
LASLGKPVWVRFVLVPGLTDAPENVEGIARFVAPMRNVEWVEVLPFHQMGAFKWKAMGLQYELLDTAPPSPELVQRVLGQFRDAGCRAR